MVDIQFCDDVYVTLIRSDATDSGVLHAARVSTMGDLLAERFGTWKEPADQAGDAEQVKKDKGLINYLMRDRHGSPFEHNSMTFFIRAPIFVFREFMRHRAGWSYNEESGRYRELKPMFYVPSEDRKLVQQGRPGHYDFAEGSDEQKTVTWNLLSRNSMESYEIYQTLLEHGVAREVARMALPVNIFSSMYATCNARSLMHFLGLRTQHELARVPSFPQREIEMVGEKMEAEWANLMPLTYEAFNANGRIAP